MMNCYTLLSLYTQKYLNVWACERADIRTCTRGQNELKRGVICVRAWSVKRAGMEWQSYKALLLYVAYIFSVRQFNTMFFIIICFLIITFGSCYYQVSLGYIFRNV